MGIEVYDNLDSWWKEREMADKVLEEWESRRIIKRCKNKCFDRIDGQKIPRMYSYDPEHEDDPGYCQRCRHAEGELIL
jgi:hypothetical protein